eukprot:287302_1
MKRAKAVSLRVCCVVSLLNIYCTAVIEGRDVDKYKCELMQLFEVLDAFVDSLKGNGVPYFVCRVKEALCNIQKQTNEYNHKVIATKCSEILGKIEQEEKEEELRE